MKKMIKKIVEFIFCKFFDVHFYVQVAKNNYVKIYKCKLCKKLKVKNRD